MLVLGIDAHKRTHTLVVVNEVGRSFGTIDSLDRRAAVVRSLSTAVVSSRPIWAVLGPADRRGTRDHGGLTSRGIAVGDFGDRTAARSFGLWPPCGLATHKALGGLAGT
jgi:hypothetical protein